jgi:hypothetical protein
MSHLSHLTVELIQISKSMVSKGYKWAVSSFDDAGGDPSDSFADMLERRQDADHSSGTNDPNLTSQGKQEKTCSEDNVIESLKARAREDFLNKSCQIEFSQHELAPLIKNKVQKDIVDSIGLCTTAKEVEEPQSAGLEKLCDAAVLSMDLLLVKEEEVSQMRKSFREDALGGKSKGINTVKWWEGLKAMVSAAVVGSSNS